MKTKERRNAMVTSVHLELTTIINERLEHYCREFGWSKRRITEEALFFWLNERDMERHKKEGGS